MSSREDYPWTDEAKNLKEGLPPNQNRESSPTQQNNPTHSIEERAKDYSYTKAVVSFDSNDGNPHYNTEEIEKAYKAGFVAGSSQGSEGDAVEFIEWCYGQGFVQYADHMPFHDSPELYWLFIKSKQP